MPGPISKRSGAAVVVGISDYLHAGRVPRLGYAAVDARAVFRALVDPDLCNFPAENVLLLTDKEATRAEIVATLSRWLPEKARDQEIVVVYFTGHGLVERAGAREQGFLLTHDTDPDDLGDRAVAMSDVVGWIRGLGAGAVVICLDCCHAGKVIPRKGVATRSASADSFGGSAARFRDMQPVAFEALSGKGRFILASCDEGQSSLEADELKHGLFTYHLLRGLEGEADTNSDGRVGVAELFEYVAQKVEQDARSKFQREQRPWNHASGTGGVYLSAPRRRSDPSGGPDVERMWKEEGAAAAVTEIERQMAGASVEVLLRLLRQLRAMGDPAGVVVVFRYLPHPNEEVRKQAHKALHAIGWEAAVAVVKEQARREDADVLGAVLDGLAAYQAHREVVSLLDDLVPLLKGDLRVRVFRLLERKQLGLELEKTAALFREIRSPYRILKVLGQGLFASAYQARDESANHDVVIRVLRPEFALMPHMRTEFLEVSGAALRHVHQNLVCTRQIHSFGEHNLYCVVRDYVDGVTLQRLFDADRRFEPPQALKIVRQILAGLEPVHRGGRPHGGVKPSNVFVCADDRVILGDPSLPPARAAGAALERLAYDYRYAAPEIFRGEIGSAADLYAVGCVLYELLCGRPPFVANDPFDLATRHDRDRVPLPSRNGSALGADGDAILMRLLAKAPRERPSGIAEVIAKLDALEATHRPFPAPRPAAGPSSLLPTDNGQSLVAFELSLEQSTGGTVVPASRPPQFPPRQTDLPRSIGPYQVRRELGRGAFGVVYLAHDAQLDRDVAIKVLNRDALASSKAVERFSREARVVAQMHHNGIVPVYHLGEHDGAQFIVSRFIPGQALSEAIPEEGMDPGRAVDLVIQLLEALAYAHDLGVLHRDVKPTNAILDAQGRLFLMDFGLAGWVGQRTGRMTQDGTVMGTPSYMAPEQARGDLRHVGPASDQYSAGVVLYELLTGHLPFEGGPIQALIYNVINTTPPRPSDLHAGLDLRLEEICLKALEKDPALRYPSCQVFADTLRAWRETPGESSAPIRQDSTPARGDVGESTPARPVPEDPSDVPLPRGLSFRAPFGGRLVLIVASALALVALAWACWLAWSLFH